MSWHTQQTNKKENDSSWSDFQSGPTVMATPLSSQPATAGYQQWSSSQYGVSNNQMGGLNPVPSHTGFGMGPSAMYGNMGGQQHNFGQTFGQNPNPQMFGQIPNPQLFGQVPNQQMAGQISNPQMFGQAPNPQMIGQVPNPQMFGQAPNPQMVGQVPNPQMFGQAPNPQMVGQAPNPQMVGQVPNPQMVGQVPNPQIFGQSPNPQLGAGIPTQQRETSEEQRWRIEREEKQTREAEITKRKLQNIKVSKLEGSKGSGTLSSLETLIGFNPESKTVPKPAPVQSSSPRSTPTPVLTSNPKSKPVSNPNIATVTTDQQFTGKEENASKLHKSTNKPDVSYDDLLTGTLMNLNKTVSGAVRKTDFKMHNDSNTATGSASAVFADSTKSRQWGSTDTNISFEGLFAQHQAPPTTTPTPLIETTTEDDSFGEFQSIPVTMLPHDTTTLLQQSSQLSNHSFQQQYSPIVTHTAYPQTRSPQVTHATDPVMVGEATPQTKEGTLPFWAVSKTYPLPQVYTNVIKVCSKDNNLVDTNILFQILISSDIERSILKDLWTEVNKTIPGTLIVNELICLLALIGLLQGGKLSVTMADITGLMVPPPVTLATENILPTKPQVVTDRPHPQQVTDDFGDFQGSNDVMPVSKQSRHTPTMSHTPLSADNSPYSAIKSMHESSTNMADQQQQEGDPYAAFKTDSVSQTVPDESPSDPYSALRTLNNSNPVTDAAILMSTSNEGVVLPSSTPPMIPTSGPTSNEDVVSATPTIQSNQQNTSSGWADFALFQNQSSTSQNRPDTFGDFSGFAGTVPSSTTPPLNPSPVPVLLPSNTPLIPTTDSSASCTPVLDKKYTVKIVEHFEVWRSCLIRCDELLDQCTSVLCDNSVDQSLLEEIVRNEESQEQLREIIEVYRFAKRVHFSSRGPGRKFMTPERSQSLMTIMMGIKKKWNKLCKTLPDNTMTSLSESPCSPTSTLTKHDTKCSLCLLPPIISISSLVTIDGYNEQYSLLMNDDSGTITSNGKPFHCQCMDFWVKALDRDLTAIP